MFNKAKDETAMPEPLATQQSAAPVRRRVGGGAASILGPDLVITGTIYSEGEIQLDGAVEGDVRAGSLTLGENASIKGEVEADLAVIHGHLVGSLRAREVRLASTSRIEGDIIHSTLSIEAGAYFEGQCRRADNPLSDAKGGGRGAGQGQTQSQAQAKKPAASYYTTSGGTASAPTNSGGAVPADKALNAE